MSTCIPLAACLISGVALCMMHTKCVPNLCQLRVRPRPQYKSVRVLGEAETVTFPAAAASAPKKSILTSRWRLIHCPQRLLCHLLLLYYF